MVVESTAVFSDMERDELQIIAEKLLSDLQVILGDGQSNHLRYIAFLNTVELAIMQGIGMRYYMSNTDTYDISFVRKDGLSGFI